MEDERFVCEPARREKELSTEFTEGTEQEREIEKEKERESERHFAQRREGTEIKIEAAP